jgi:Ni,Fe-hydrogenase maturation factor
MRSMPDDQSIATTSPGVVVLLIEAETVELGIGLSAPVTAAIDKVVTRIEALIDERLAALAAAS